MIQDRRLRAVCSSESKQLSALVDAAVNTANGKSTSSAGSMLVSRIASRLLTVNIMPLAGVASPFALGSCGCRLHLDPEARVQLPEDLLQTGYGLTKAEARLALLLAEGHSLTDAAEGCGVTHNTVRSQLKSIFLKTGVRHQGELIRLLLQSAQQ